MISSAPAVLKINISDISSDELFKVSKNYYQTSLTSSLKLSGMLDVPYVYKTGSDYKIITCHNRLKILREQGLSALNCFVLDEPDSDIFMNHVALKSYRNEIGSFGKLKALFILDTFFNLPESARKDYCTKVLKLPLEIIENESYLTKILAFPEHLIWYIDEKDINFKLIKDISLLPAQWIEVIARWIKGVQVRVNIFRMLVDNVFDIYRRGDSLTSIESIPFNDDKTLYDSVYRLRYPGFSKLKLQSDNLINELSGAGLTIDFPEYFDRRFVTLKLDIDKKTDCSDQLKKISKINIEKLKELLSFL